MDPLESERHEAIRIMAAAVAEDRLPIRQLESRLALVRQAPNRATLEAIVADLAPSGECALPLGVARTSTDPAALAPIEPAEVLRISTVLSSSKRAGSWTVPLRLEIRGLIGDLTVDLRDAIFCSDVLDIDLDLLLGNLVIIVPAGAQVENEAEERWSSTSHSTRSARGAGPIGLLIRLTGRVRWSNVEIKEKRRTGEKPPSRLKRLLGGA